MNACPLPNCGKTLSTRYKLKLHIQRHHFNIKRYPCVHCLKSFKSSDSLKRHQLSHQPKEPQMPFNPYVSPLTEGRVEVPLLTEMVKKSKDVDLMPGVHVDYLYLFKTDNRLILLPAIRDQ